MKSEAFSRIVTHMREGSLDSIIPTHTIPDTHGWEFKNLKASESTNRTEATGVTLLCLYPVLNFSPWARMDHTCPNSILLSET